MIKLAAISLLLILLFAVPFLPAQGLQNRGYGYGPGIGQPALDLANQVLVEGTIESVDMVPGRGQPTITILKNDGGSATFLVGPYRELRNAAFSLRPGDQVSVTGYPSLVHTGSLVAAQIRNLTTGEELQLRDDRGNLRYRGCGCCPNN